MDKKIIYIFLGIIIILIIVMYITNISKKSDDLENEYFKELSPGIFTNTSELLKNEKSTNNYKITDAFLNMKDGISYIKFKIVNTSGSNIDKKDLKVKFITSQNTIIKELYISINPLKKGEEIMIKYDIQSDLSNCIDIIFEEVIK